MKKLSNWHPYWLSFPEVFTNKQLDMSVLDFILNCYHKFEGGFGDNPTDQDFFTNSTAKAVICLNLFKKMDNIKTNDIYSFTRSCQNSDGGFGITSSKKNLFPSSLESTFYSIITLNLLGYLPHLKLHLPKTIKWVLSHYNTDGGFHGDESVISNEYYTFLALTTLDILKGLDKIDLNLTKGFLISSEIKKNPEATITTSRLIALYLLDGLDDLNIKISISRLARCQNKSGGFRNRKISLVYQSDMFSTFQAIIGLTIIEFSKRIKKELAINWILSCQNKDGGFGNKPNSKSSISNTFAALISLFYLIHA